MSPLHRLASLPPDWQAVVVGAASAPALLVLGLVIGVVEGLIPGCEGLACLYGGLVLGYSGALLLVWGVIALVVAATRRRWPRSSARTWVVRLLALLSWALLLWPVALFLERP